MEPLDDWQLLIRTQSGVVTRAQLLARGFTDHGIRAQLDAGRWQPLHDGVYITYSGPPTADTLRAGALLACRQGGLLSHETAAELHGFLKPDQDRPIHVTVRYGCGALGLDGVTVHRSRAFAHIAEVGSDPPRTNRVHTVLDLAVASPDAVEAMRRAHQYALDARVHPAALEQAAELRRPRRFRRAIDDAVALLHDGVLSALEYRYLVDVEQAHGLPTGTRQAPVVVDGVRRYEDITYELPRGRAIVRLDGFEHHSDRRVALIDRRRAVAAVLAGAPSVPYGWTEVTTNPCLTGREVETLLRPLGWAGPFLTCPRCS